MSLNSIVTVPSGNSPTPRLLPQIPVSYDLGHELFSYSDLLCSSAAYRLPASIRSPAVRSDIPRRYASQACSGGSAGLEPPDASGAGEILFSQHSGHSTCGRPCRPCSCSHAKYAAPATSTKLRPPPKGRPGALGMGGGIAVHLSIDTAVRSGVIAGSRPLPV